MWDASAAAAERVGTVISVHVIPRPADDVTRMLKGGKEPEEPTPPEPEKPSEPEISLEPDTLSEPEEPESEAVKAEEGEKGCDGGRDADHGGGCAPKTGKGT